MVLNESSCSNSQKICTSARIPDDSVSQRSDMTGIAHLIAVATPETERIRNANQASTVTARKLADPQC